MSQINKEFMIIILSALFFITFLVTLCVIAISNDEEEEIEACEQVGGEYKVIDKVWINNQYMNTYGCVK
jgi:hypothetical protein